MWIRSESGMREAVSSELEVEEVGVEVFRKLLEHLYTDTDNVCLAEASPPANSLRHPHMPSHRPQPSILANT